MSTAFFLRRLKPVTLTVLAALTAVSMHVRAAGSAAPADSAELMRGEYLTRAADCIACHTASPQHPYAGGVPFKTPFGTVYSTNITPDERAGIGSFTDAEFISAVREGVSKRGRLYPAMPYTSYTQLTDDDIKAIRAYLSTVRKDATQPPANTLPFPFNQRWSMVFWNLLNFRSERFHPDPAKSAEWNRGAYLVGALAHCQECHTPRNIALGLRDKPLAGAQLGNWTAYNITSDKTAGIGAWRDADIVSYLRDGVAPGKANAAGPMAEVVTNSTRFLSEADLQAMAVYLRDVPAHADGSTKARSAWGKPVAGLEEVRGQALTVVGAQSPVTGRTLYSANCASCHGWSGTGVGTPGSPGAYPSLVGNTTVGASNADNLTMVILHGVDRETNHGHLLMPAFASHLSDDDVALLTNFVTAQFGNPAVKTTAKAVAARR